MPHAHTDAAVTTLGLAIIDVFDGVWTRLALPAHAQYSQYYRGEPAGRHARSLVKLHH